MDPVTVPVIPAPLQAMVFSQHHDVPGAIPLPDQTAVRITNALVKVFTEYGLPDIIHSD